MTTSDSEIQGYLRNHFGYDPTFPQLPVFADTRYRYPEPNWFFGKFASEFGRFCDGIDNRSWWQKLTQSWFSPHKFDCDDFASGARWFAQVLNRRDNVGEGALAVAEFWYYRGGRPDDEHSIVMAMFAPDSVGFLEPQSRQQVFIAPDEKCTWYRF
jgi:hypothetical protein